ncbi:hypothetical protein Ga0080559_TMP1912 [Salipiger profundus]|uniref:Uncharacterized protein n=1 Tax=Salipiger profundus TaxID=1229727 RepID=A0A1U7D3M8_9RHOB|nr:hypothetical protein Ga0080559_TMP1912 [Salipiger profundus]
MRTVNNRLRNMVFPPFDERLREIRCPINWLQRHFTAW